MLVPYEEIQNITYDCWQNKTIHILPYQFILIIISDSKYVLGWKIYDSDSDTKKPYLPK